MSICHVVSVQAARDLDATARRDHWVSIQHGPERTVTAYPAQEKQRFQPGRPSEVSLPINIVKPDPWGTGHRRPRA